MSCGHQEASRVIQMDLTDFVLLIAFFVGSVLGGALLQHKHAGHKAGFADYAFYGIGGGILFAALVYGL